MPLIPENCELCGKKFLSDPCAVWFEQTGVDKELRYYSIVLFKPDEKVVCEPCSRILLFGPEAIIELLIYEARRKIEEALEFAAAHLPSYLGRLGKARDDACEMERELFRARRTMGG